ncbi:FAD-binding protein [Candidatus Bathyarchaeota archaeon]|nr:FAD-binding protein [Candidatus Bathyarchaeota archaeon]
MIYKNRVEIDDLEGLVTSLKDIVGENWVSTEEADLVAYSKDAQLITGRWLIEGKIPGLPHVITWPGSEEEISSILEVANMREIPVVPFGEGSGVVGAAIPVRGGIVVDMKRFNKIMDINDSNLTVTVQSGMNGKELERALEQEGYLIGHVPQSFHTSSVGGWIAHRAAGQFSTKYGKIEDMVTTMRVVLPTGEIIDTKEYPRAADGPQIERLFLGSEGTFGIVTQATLRMWPLPGKTAGTAFAFDTIEASLEAVRLILRQQVYPAVVRIYDKTETSRHFYDVKRAKKRVMVVFVCEGTERLVNFELSIVREACRNAGGVDCGNSPVEHWFDTRFQVTETSKFTPKDLIFDTIEVSCMWDDASRLYHGVIEEVSNVKGVAMVSAHASHFYPQGVCFYFSFGGVPVSGETPLEFYNTGWDAAMKATLEAGGAISHHHGIGLVRARWMADEHGDMLDMMKRIKHVLDPRDIMNPGKLLDEDG